MTIATNVAIIGAGPAGALLSHAFESDDAPVIPFDAAEIDTPRVIRRTE